MGAVRSPDEWANAMVLSCLCIVNCFGDPDTINVLCVFCCRFCVLCVLCYSLWLFVSLLFVCLLCCWFALLVVVAPNNSHTVW